MIVSFSLLNINRLDPPQENKFLSISSGDLNKKKSFWNYRKMFWRSKSVHYLIIIKFIFIEWANEWKDNMSPHWWYLKRILASEYVFAILLSKLLNFWDVIYAHVKIFSTPQPCILRICVFCFKSKLIGIKVFIQHMYSFFYTKIWNSWQY